MDRKKPYLCYYAGISRCKKCKQEKELRLGWCFSCAKDYGQLNNIGKKLFGF